MITWLKQLDANDWLYFVGVGLLFVGLSLGVSVATALSVVGAVLIALSTAKAYFVTWLSIRKK